MQDISDVLVVKCFNYEGNSSTNCQRVSLENGKSDARRDNIKEIIMDVHNVCDIALDTQVRVVLSERLLYAEYDKVIDSNVIYAMNGYVYQICDTVFYMSCGGMLVKVTVGASSLLSDLKMNTHLFVYLLGGDALTAP